MALSDADVQKQVSGHTPDRRPIESGHRAVDCIMLDPFLVIGEGCEGIPFYATEKRHFSQICSQKRQSDSEWEPQGHGANIWVGHFTLSDSWEEGSFVVIDGR